MTKKQWYKLKLEVTLGKIVSSHTVLYGVGWCLYCKHRKGGTEESKTAAQGICEHYNRKCQKREIPTTTSDGRADNDTWYSYYYPKEFTDD